MAHEGFGDGTAGGTGRWKLLEPCLYSSCCALDPRAPACCPWAEVTGWVGAGVCEAAVEVVEEATARANGARRPSPSLTTPSTLWRRARVSLRWISVQMCLAIDSSFTMAAAAKPRVLAPVLSRVAWR